MLGPPGPAVTTSGTRTPTCPAAQRQVGLVLHLLKSGDLSCRPGISEEDEAPGLPQDLRIGCIPPVHRDVELSRIGVPGGERCHSPDLLRGPVDVTPVDTQVGECVDHVGDRGHPHGRAEEEADSGTDGVTDRDACRGVERERRSVDDARQHEQDRAQHRCPPQRATQVRVRDHHHSGRHGEFHGRIAGAHTLRHSVDRASTGWTNQPPRQHARQPGQQSGGRPVAEQRDVPADDRCHDDGEDDTVEADDPDCGHEPVEDVRRRREKAAYTELRSGIRGHEQRRDDRHHRAKPHADGV